MGVDCGDACASASVADTNSNWRTATLSFLMEAPSSDWNLQRNMQWNTSLRIGNESHTRDDIHSRFRTDLLSKLALRMGGRARTRPKQPDGTPTPRACQRLRACLRACLSHELVNRYGPALIAVADSRFKPVSSAVHCGDRSLEVRMWGNSVVN